MYDWAMKCAACEQINSSEYFPNDTDICVDCQEEIIPDQLKLPFGEGEQG
jgi:hypothetical protein